MTVPAEKVDDIRQQYEPIIEAQMNEKDDIIRARSARTSTACSTRPDWREQLHKTRDQMPKQDGDMLARWQM